MLRRGVLYFLQLLLPLGFSHFFLLKGFFGGGDLRTEGVTQCTDCEDKLPLLP